MPDPEVLKLLDPIIITIIIITTIYLFVYLETEFHPCCPGWSAMEESQIIATSACQPQVILLPQPPE